jgi:hypothetical protein
MKSLSWAVGGLTLLATGGYLFTYIYRWEWHRALLVGVLFLGILIALGTALVLRRLAALQRQLAAGPGSGAGDEDVLHRLRQAPQESAPFPWLKRDSLERTSIFIPILLGGGVVVSAVAWLVERLAGSSARAGVEAEVAGELRSIAFPRTALVPTDAELLACDDAFTDDPQLRLLLGPATHRQAS